MYPRTIISTHTPLPSHATPRPRHSIPTRRSSYLARHVTGGQRLAILETRQRGRERRIHRPVLPTLIIRRHGRRSLGLRQRYGGLYCRLLVLQYGIVGVDYLHDRLASLAAHGICHR